MTGFVADGLRTAERPRKWRVERCYLDFVDCSFGPWYVYGPSVPADVSGELGELHGSHYATWHEAVAAARRGYALEFNELNVTRWLP